MQEVVHHRSELASGLPVVVVELPHLHTATVVLYAKVGSRFESPSDNGLSHFVEHMLFRGTTRYPSSYALNFAIEDLGGTLYAETGRDYSMFQVALEAAQVEPGLALFGEIFANPGFADIELERKLILEEINEDYDEKGVEINGYDIARALVFGEHPLSQRIIGPRANVMGFTIDDVRRHFDRNYCARNMLLCVAGPVHTREVVDDAQKHLGELPAGELVATVSPSFAQSAPLYKFIPDSGSQTSVNVLFRAVPELDPDYVAAIALVRALDDGMSTPLHYQLCDQLGLAYSIQAGLDPLHDVALVDISASTANANVAALLDRLLALVASFRDQPVSGADLAKLKRRYRYELVSAADDANAMAGWFGGTGLYYPPPSFTERIRAVDALTAADLCRVAKRIIQPDRLAVAVVGSLTRARQAEVRATVNGFST